MLCSMDFEALCDALRTAPQAVRSQLWRTLPHVSQQRRLSSGELDMLRDLLLDERELEIRTAGALLLDRVIHAQRAQPKPESFHDWLFSSFRPPFAATAGASPAPSLVLTVCDAEYIRDVQAQVEIARHLPADRYPHTHFRHVPLQSPNWSDIELDRASA